jgi:NAD+ diphosphatase
MIAAISSRDGQRVLLARSKRHPPKLHTVLAGFVEAGETFEAAVARETFEETGIHIDEGSVQYVGSQPWPFPQSCMIGFTATADDTVPLNIDTVELVSARWFDKSEVIKAASVEGPTMQHPVAEAALKNDPTLPLIIPPKGVIARKLIDKWLAD